MSTGARLLAAAALCVVSLGIGWAGNMSSDGYLTTGYYTYGAYADTSYYTPGYFVEGDPLDATPGAGADVRVVLVPAAAAFAWAVRHRTVASRRAARIAVWALVAVVAIGLSRGMTGGALVAGSAAALAWPAVHGRVRATRA